jgi:hypothetical protein
MKRLVLIVLIFPVVTHGWSNEAHQVISILAEDFLTETGRLYTRIQLGSANTMASVSSWADTVDWSDDLHFAHTSPFQDCDGGFTEDEAHCPNGRCIVTAIANYTERAGNFSLSRDEQVEALKFLIHFYGDIHQPLHLGFAEDRDGTEIRFAGGFSLHELWDSALVEVGRREVVASASKRGLSYSFEMFVADLKREYTELPYERRQAILQSSPGVIASEISREYTCKEAYMNEHQVFFPRSGGTVSDEYKRTRGEVVRELLIKSAVRLADTVNTIAVRYNAQMNEARAIRRAAALAAGPPASKTTSPVPKQIRPSVFGALEFDLDEAVTDETDSSTTDYESDRSVSTVIRKPRVHKLPPTQIRSVSDDFSGIALLRRGKALIVTDRSLARKSYIPQRTSNVWVKYRKGGEYVDQLISFDDAVFGAGSISGDVYAKCLEIFQGKNGKHMKVEDGKVVATRGFLPDFGKPTAGLKDWDDDFDFFNEIISKMTKPTSLVVRMSPADQLEYFKSRFDQTCIFLHKTFIFIVDHDTLKQPAMSRMRFNRYSFIDMSVGETGFIMMDRNLYDGKLSKDLKEYLPLLKRNRHSASRKYLNTRSTFRSEIVFLSHLFTSVNHSKNEKDKDFYFPEFLIAPDSPEYNFWRVEWALGIDSFARLSALPDSFS